MNPTDVIFQVVSDLTGGLITDLTMVVISIVTLGFIVMGIGLIKNLLLSGSEGSGKYEKEDKEEKKLFAEFRDEKRVGD